MDIQTLFSLIGAFAGAFTAGIVWGKTTLKKLPDWGKKLEEHEGRLNDHEKRIGTLEQLKP